jgi:hypothetical protein
VLGADHCGELALETLGFRSVNQPPAVQSVDDLGDIVLVEVRLGYRQKLRFRLAL